MGATKVSAGAVYGRRTGATGGIGIGEKRRARRRAAETGRRARGARVRGEQ